MTLHVVLADPPRPGLVLTDLVTDDGLTAAEAAELYSAMMKDTFMAIRGSGGELLVNYRPNELLPPAVQSDTSVESEVRSLASQALDDLGDARFEVQVGSSLEARVGNTVMHLFREEDVASIAILTGQSPTLARTVLDSAAMKLRRSNVVIAPAPGGRASYVGLTDPIEFTGAFEAPVVGSLVDRAVANEYRVDFLPMQPVVDAPSDLVTLVAVLRAMHAADRIVPVYTMDFIDRVGLRVTAHDGQPTLTRD